MFRIALAVICLVFGVCSCSDDQTFDPTDRILVASAIDESEFAVKGATYVTDAVPVAIPNSSLKKVSVQRGTDNFRYLAFVEPDQAKKITRKGQRVKLYVIQFHGSTTSGYQFLILARAE